MAFSNNSYSLQHLGKEVSSGTFNATEGSWGNTRESTSCTKCPDSMVFFNDNSYCSWIKTQGKMKHWFDLREDFLCSFETQIHPNNVLFPLPHTQFEKLYGKDKHREDFLLKMQHSNAKWKRFTRSKGTSLHNVVLKTLCQAVESWIMVPVLCSTFKSHWFKTSIVV